MVRVRQRTKLHQGIRQNLQPRAIAHNTSRDSRLAEYKKLNRNRRGKDNQKAVQRAVEQGDREEL